MVFVPVRSRGGEAGKVRSDDDSRREAGNQRLLDRPHIALVHYMLLIRWAEWTLAAIADAWLGASD